LQGIGGGEMIPQLHWSNIMISSKVEATIHPQDVIREAAKAAGVSEEAFSQERRFPDHVTARTMAAAYMKLFLKKTYHVVAEALRKDHTSIVNNVKNHKKWMGNNKPYRDKFNQMRMMLEGTEVPSC